MSKALLFLVFSFTLLSSQAHSQSDTLKLSLRQADSVFVNANYYLLASAMNVEAERAQIIQASLFPNPVITGEVNAYDPQNREILHAGRTGQKSFQLEQLVLIGGKRRSEIEIAKTNVSIAELELRNLTRELKFKLHTELIQISQQQALLNKYNSQLALLDTILTAYEAPVKKGFIPLKDYVRLKGVYLNLNNDRAELLQQFYEAQAIVQTLLLTDLPVKLNFSDREIESYIKVRDIEDLKLQALENHPELLILQQNRVLATQYLQYQKRLAIPDVNVFTSYDQRGGAFLNQVNTGISVPLPTWNRNQGNIKTARFRIRESEYALQAKQQEGLSAVQNNFALYTQTVTEYQKASRLYNSDFEVTVKGMIYNFQKRNVSLIEFVDFFESYNQVLAELARMKTQLVTSAELLNLSIGKDVF